MIISKAAVERGNPRPYFRMKLRTKDVMIKAIATKAVHRRMIASFVADLLLPKKVSVEPPEMLCDKPPVLLSWSSTTTIKIAVMIRWAMIRIDLTSILVPHFL